MMQYSQNIYLGKDGYDILQILKSGTGKSASEIVRSLLKEKYRKEYVQLEVGQSEKDEKAGDN